MSEMLLEPAEDVRRWRLVSAGLKIQSAGLRLALISAILGGALFLTLDRSDRGASILIFGAGQLLLAIAQAVGLGLISCGPDSDTRKQARRAGWLVVTSLVLLAVMLLATFWPARLGSIGAALQRQIVTAAFLSLLVNIAILGYLWLGVHAALGRDLADPHLTSLAARFAEAWLVVSTCAGVATVANLIRVPLAAADPFQSMATAVVVIILEPLYLVLVERSRRALLAAA